MYYEKPYLITQSDFQIVSLDGANELGVFSVAYLYIYFNWIKIQYNENETHLLAVNVVISTLFEHAVNISSQLLPPVMRCTALSDTSSLEFLPAFAALPLDGTVLCLAACLCLLSAKNSANTAFNFASRMSTAVTCSNPWTFWACRKSKQHWTFSNCKNRKQNV